MYLEAKTSFYIKPVISLGPSSLRDVDLKSISSLYIYKLQCHFSVQNLKPYFLLFFLQEATVHADRLAAGRS